MEALEFLKQAQRLCEQSKYCSAVCPLYEKCIFDFMYENESSKETWERIEKAAATIEQWSKDHPIVTNAQKFKEVFGFYGDVVNRSKPERGIAGTKGSCGYDDCRESCGSRHYPRCPMWWDDGYKEPEHED